MTLSDIGWRTAMQHKHSVAVVGTVLRADGCVLVIKRRDNGHWEAPGGVLEAGESFKDGVRREVLEETGVEVAVKRLTGVYKNTTRDIVCVVYECAQISGEPAPTSEAAEVRWMRIADATARMTPAHAVRILDALTETSTSRIHDGVDIIPE